MSRPLIIIAIFVSLGVVLLGCGGSSFPQCGGDLLFFSRRGWSSFDESVKLICPDGSQEQTFLATTPTRGFFDAEGPSLSGEILVSAEDFPSTPGPTALHLYLYRPTLGQLTRLTVQDGTDGFGALSPDAGRVVYQFVPNGGPNQVVLWVKDLSTGRELQLTTQTQPRTNDVFPLWKPDGQEIWFLHVVYPPDFSTLATTLMRESASRGQPSVVFGPDQDVGSVAFSAAGDRFAMESLQGIEIVDAATLQRSVVLPHSAFAGNSFWVGSLLWSADRDLLAFVEIVPQTNQWEIWTVKPDGTDLKMIHTEIASEMYLGGFVQP
jgi:hypothetical protein